MGKTTTLDPKDEKGLLRWTTELVDDGLARRRPVEAQWWENIAAYNGDLWVEYDPDSRRLTEPIRADHKVRLPINLVKGTVRTEYAKLLKNRPMIDCLARSDEQEDINSAKVGDKLLNSYIEKQLSMPKVRRRMLQWVLLTGMGGIFVDYDAVALGEQEVLIDGQGNPVFDQRMVSAIQRYYRDKKKAPKVKKIPQGELRMKALSPFQFMWDFSQLEFEDAWWVIISEVYDVDEVWRKWGKEVDGDQRAQPGVIDRRMLQRWDLSGSLEWNMGTTQQMAEVHRMFIKPGHRYFPEGAELVFTKNEMLLAQDFPYSHGMLPMAVCGHVPFPVSQHGSSVVQDAKPIALEISKTISQMLENRNLMGNPMWIEFDKNQIVGEIQNKPGMRLTVKWMPNVPEPHPVEMPDLPNYVQALVPMMKEVLLEVTGQSEVSQGKVPAGARAGVTIAYLQEEDDTKLGPTVMEYEEASERVAWLQLRTIAEKYDAPRVIRVYKRHGDPEVFDFMGSMLEGVAGVICQAGSALPRSKAAKQQFILDLWDRKIEQDPRKLREMLELTQGDPDDWEMDVGEAERENRKMIEGQHVEVMEWQNHQAHHYQHRRLMKSAEFDELPGPVRVALVQHDDAHTQYEKKQAMQQAMMNQLSGGGSPPAPGQDSPMNGTNATAPPDGTAQPSPPQLGPGSDATELQAEPPQ